MSDIDNVFLELDTKLRKFKEEFGVEFVARVKRRTPVVTGKLQAGWGFDMHETSIEVYNTQPYASFVEYGTPRMEPRGMLRTTLLEKEQIAAAAKKAVGL